MFGKIFGKSADKKKRKLGGPMVGPDDVSKMFSRMGISLSGDADAKSADEIIREIYRREGVSKMPVFELQRKFSEYADELKEKRAPEA